MTEKTLVTKKKEWIPGREEWLYRLPENANLMVLGDMHGNAKSWEKIQQQIKKHLKGGGHALFLGDALHRGSPEGNANIMQDILELSDKYGENLQYVIGNHDIEHLKGAFGFIPTATPGSETLDIGGEHVTQDLVDRFEKFLSENGNMAVKSANGILFVHGGAAKGINSEQDLIKPPSGIAKQIIWNDPHYIEFPWGEKIELKDWEDSDRKISGVFKYGQPSLEEFLKKVKAKFMISGHGHFTTHLLNNQFQLVTGYEGGKEDFAYMVIDTGKSLKDALENSVRDLDGNEHEKQVDTRKIKKFW